MSPDGDPEVEGGRSAQVRIAVAIDDLTRLATECSRCRDQVEGTAAHLWSACRTVEARLPWLWRQPGQGAVVAAASAFLVTERAVTTTRLAALSGHVALAASGYQRCEQANTALAASLDRLISGVSGVLAEQYPPRTVAVHGPVDLPARPAPAGVADLLARLDALDPPASQEAELPPGRVDVWPLAEGTYLVVLPGTSSWALPWSADRPDIRTLQANLSLLAGRSSTEVRALPQALARAGVPDGARLVLVGHSQGGMTAVAAAGDPQLRERYAVSHVLTAGSPVAGMAVPPGVEVLSLEHRADPVPLLDGHRNPERSGQVTVRFGAAGPISGQAHALGGYRSVASWVDRSDHPDLIAWRESALAGLGSGTAPATRAGVRVVLTSHPVGSDQEQ